MAKQYNADFHIILCIGRVGVGDDIDVGANDIIMGSDPDHVVSCIDLLDAKIVGALMLSTLIIFLLLCAVSISNHSAKNLWFGLQYMQPNN